jgi:hypothetical protein
MDQYGNIMNTGVPMGSEMRSGGGTSMLDVIGFASVPLELGYGYMSSSWLDSKIMNPASEIHKERMRLKKAQQDYSRDIRKSGRKNKNKKARARAANTLGKAQSRFDDFKKDLPYTPDELSEIRHYRSKRRFDIMDSPKYKGSGYKFRDVVFGSKSNRKGIFGWFDGADEARMKAANLRANEDTMKKLAGMTGKYQNTAKAFVAAKSFARLANYTILADIGFSVGKGIYGGIASFGKMIKHQGGMPEQFSEGFMDTQAAFTMRQRSMQAIQRAQLGARRSLGNEAAILHSNR